MKQLIFLLFASFFLQCTNSKNSANEEVSSTERLPNMLIFLIDDLGKEWISCYGAQDIQTPNIDALAASGTRFNNVYSMPQCTPTRLSLLTGQYPFRHGWVNHWDVPRWGGGAHFDETQYPTLGKAMKAAGYKTAIAGKWQVNDFRVEPDALIQHGFDDYCMWTGYETGVPASAERYHDPYIFTKEGSKTYEGQFGPDVFKDFIINFIRENKEQPMFIYYPLVLPHTPLINPPAYEEEDNLGKHKAMVSYVDKLTGEVIRALEDAGIREETLVIWTTDNGSTGAIKGRLNDRLVNGGKASTTEAGISAPFIASWPGQVRAGHVSEALIDFTDLFPTCVDIAGGQLETNFVFDGSSFKNALLSGENSSQRSWIMSMGGKNNARLTEKGVENQYVYRDRVLRNQRYKLYVNTSRQADQFYDLQADPWETNNLIDSLNNPDRQKNFQALEAVIQQFPAKDSDPQYVPLPEQEWDVEISAESEVWKIK